MAEFDEDEFLAAGDPKKRGALTEAIEGLLRDRTYDRHAADEDLFEELLDEINEEIASHIRAAHQAGYSTAREDMISGAFIGGPTYEALRLSFTGQRIESNLREHLAQLLEAEIKKPVWERDIYVNDGLRDAARIVRGKKPRG